jgi:hypothetical protein
VASLQSAGAFQFPLTSRLLARFHSSVPIFNDNLKLVAHLRTYFSVEFFRVRIGTIDDDVLRDLVQSPVALFSNFDAITLHRSDACT